MSTRTDSLQWLAQLRSAIVDLRSKIGLLSSKEVLVDARLADLSAIDTTAAAIDRASLKEYRLSLVEAKLNARFLLKESGSVLLTHGKVISDALEIGDLLEALSVDPKDFEGIEICGGGVLHTIFAHGLENSAAMRGRDFIDFDLQPLTAQFNFALVDWMCQTNAGHKAGTEALEQTFGPIPDGWKHPPTILKKCGVQS